MVTLDADGQHLPSEMERLVDPVLEGEVAVAHGSRVLGDAEPNHHARELGIVFFNRMVSLITRTKVSDCSNGYRAVRVDVLPQLVLRQEQFHTSEFLIEAIKRGIPAKEIPVTVARRRHGHSKKPAVVRYGTRLRERDRPDLAALTRSQPLRRKPRLRLRFRRARACYGGRSYSPLPRLRRQRTRVAAPYPACSGPAVPGCRTSEGSGR